VARTAVDAFWREQIRGITANYPGWGPGRVVRALAAIGEQLGRDDWPAERTIGREQQRFREMEAAKQRDYLVFRWPESMVRGDLPWEAAALGVTLIRHFGQRRRPLVRCVRWCWRITLARPDAPLPARWNAACFMAAWEVSPDASPEAPRRIEAWLAGGDELPGELTIHYPNDEAFDAFVGYLEDEAVDAFVAYLGLEEGDAAEE